MRRCGGTNGEGEEFLRTRLDREIATSRVPRDRIDRSAADGFVTHARQGGLERLESRLEVLETADAHMADPENVALQRALPACDDRPVLLPEFLPECGIVHARWISDGGHGVGREARIRVQPETERVDSVTRAPVRG